MCIIDAFKKLQNNVIYFYTHISLYICVHACICVNIQQNVCRIHIMYNSGYLGKDTGIGAAVKETIALFFYFLSFDFL